MSWELLLLSKKEIFDVILAVFGITIVAWLIFFSGFKNALTWISAKPSFENYDVEEILDSLIFDLENQDEVEQERPHLRRVISALIQQGDRKSFDAFVALAHGEVAKTEALFLIQAETDGKTTELDDQCAIEAWWHIGALACLYDRDKAIFAFTKVTQLDPDDLAGWMRCALMQGRGKNLQAMADCYNHVITVASRSGDKQITAEATGKLALMYLGNNDLENAVTYYQRSLTYNTELSNQEAMASDCDSLGAIFDRYGDLVLAEQMLLKSVALYYELGNIDTLAKQYSKLGKIYQKHNNPHKAIEMHQHSFVFNNELGRTVNMAEESGCLGLLHEKLGELNKAEEMYLRALELEKQLGRKEGMARQYGNLALVYDAEGDLGKAAPMHQKSLELSEEIAKKATKAKTEEHVGQRLVFKGHLDEARGHYLNSEDLYSDLGWVDEAERVAEVLKEIEEPRE